MTRALTTAQVADALGCSARSIAETLNSVFADMPRANVIEGVVIPDVPKEFRTDPGMGPFGRDIRVAIANCVYFIACEGFVKIGTSSDVKARLRTMRAMNPLPLTLLLVIVGGQPVEREMHMRFAAHRHRDEWFRLDGDLREFLISSGAQIP